MLNGALLEKHSNVTQNYTEQTILAEQNTRTRDLYSVKLTPNRWSQCTLGDCEGGDKLQQVECADCTCPN